jgi:hypothetical protein
MERIVFISRHIKKCNEKPCLDYILFCCTNLNINIMRCIVIKQFLHPHSLRSFCNWNIDPFSLHLPLMLSTNLGFSLLFSNGGDDSQCSQVIKSEAAEAVSSWSSLWSASEEEFGIKIFSYYSSVLSLSNLSSSPKLAEWSLSLPSTIITFWGALLALTISLIFESAIFYYLCNGSGTVRVKLVLCQRGSLRALSNF